MSWGRYLKLAVILSVGSFLTLVEVLAQQGPVVARMAAATGNHQPEPVEQPKGVTDPALDGARVKGEAARNTALGEAVEPAKPKPMPEALFLPNANQLSPLDKAYLDALSILRQDNTCSRFYGGARVIEVLNELKKQLKPASLSTSIAVRMSGEIMTVSSQEYGFSYRLFDKAELNLRGSFYQGNVFANEETVPSIGRYLPNTREARVAILLHELGHLVAKPKPGKQWLLPNDGNDPFLSHKNTLQIVAVCGEQIGQLHGISFEAELQAVRSVSPDNGVQAAIQP